MRKTFKHISCCGIGVALFLMPCLKVAAETPIIHGVMIREAKVNGYFLHYHLLNWKERDLLMKGMEGMDMPGVDRSGKATNHLLLYVGGPDGKSVPQAKVGFQITAPDGSVQKTLTMVMQGGYGADVVLAQKGSYLIKMKMEVTATVENDEFVYAVK